MSCVLLMFGARNPLVNWCEVLHSTAGFGAISVILYTRYIINIMVSAILGAYTVQSSCLGSIWLTVNWTFGCFMCY